MPVTAAAPLGVAAVLTHISLTAIQGNAELLQMDLVEESEHAGFAREIIK